MRRSIGGQLTLDALALLVGSTGRQYRACDRDALRAAAHELRSRGQTVRDISAALGIAEQAVCQLLGEAP
ncbi:MAG: hypothetical protein WBE92_09695 [Steroidobacteraceae bacterium]